MNVLYSLWAVYLFIGLGVTADAFFVPTLTRISGIFLQRPISFTGTAMHLIQTEWYSLSVKWLKYVNLKRNWKDNLRLSDNVAGVTLVALGNGAPDIFSAIVRVKFYSATHLVIIPLTFSKAAFTNEDPSVSTMAVGSLLGAGMFVIMVVSGVCMIVKSFETPSWSSLRDIITYMWALFWLTQDCFPFHQSETFTINNLWLAEKGIFKKCIYHGKITLGDAIGFIVLYFIYVVFVFMQDKFFSEYELQTEKSVRPSHDGSNVEALRIRHKSFSGLILHRWFLSHWLSTECSSNHFAWMNNRTRLNIEVKKVSPIQMCCNGFAQWPMIQIVVKKRLFKVKLILKSSQTIMDSQTLHIYHLTQSSLI